MIIHLREWKAADCEALSDILNNKKVQNNLRDGFSFPYTPSDALDFINSVLNSQKDQTFAFAVTADGQVAGSIAAFRQSNIHSRTAELGYCLKEEFWGKGIMSEAVKQICSFIFSQTDIIRIFAEPFSENAASCRVLENAGFSYEGTLRCNAVKNKTVTDMKMYSLIKPQL